MEKNKETITNINITFCRGDKQDDLPSSAEVSIKNAKVVDVIFGGLSLLEEGFRKIEEYNKTHDDKMSIGSFLKGLVKRGDK